MRRAEQIVQQLLEVYDTPLAARGSVYVFGGESGHAYASLSDYAQRVAGLPTGSLTPVKAVIAKQLERGTVIVQQPDHGKLVVYSKDTPVPVSAEQLDTMQQDFHVLYLSHIGWAKDLSTRPMSLPFEHVFGSVKTMEKIRKEKEKLHKQGEKADREAQKLQVNQQRTGIETEHGSWFNPPGWKNDLRQAFPEGPNPDQALGYTEDNPEPEQENPYDLGIVPRKHARDGVLIGEIAAGSPAASSLLQPGDVIVAVGPFTSRSNEVVGPYKITKVSELQRVLGWLLGGTAFPVKAIRGSGYIEAVVMPKLKQRR